MFHLHLNHLAILVSALIQWFLGALWYSPLLFVKPWKAMIDVGVETKKSALIVGMIASFFCSLVLSFVLAHIIFWASATTFERGAFIGFIAWTGFIAAPLCAQYIYENRPFKLFAINTGYWLASLLLSGGLLAVWR